MLRILKQLVSIILIATILATPSQAMFIQPDWLDSTQPGVGTNRYAYSGNDPVNKLDPKGNEAVSPEAFDPFDILEGGGGLTGSGQAMPSGAATSFWKGVAAAIFGSGVAGVASTSNQSGGDKGSTDSTGPGIGDNGDPTPPDPDPASLTLTTIAAIVASQTNTKLASGSGVTITETDGTTVSMTIETANGPVEVVAEISVSSEAVTLTNAHIQGAGANSIGPGAVRSIARDIGRAFGVRNVTVNGGMRTSGANPGRFPDSVTIKVD